MSRVKKLLFIALGLAVVALIVNALDPTHSLLRWLKGESTWKAQYVQHFVQAKPIEPIGSENAKVRIKLFAQSMNPCHAPTLDLLKKIGEALPEQIRIEFLDTMTQEGFEARQQAGIPCEVGLLINNQKTVEVERNGQKFQASFHGPISMGMSPDLLRMALEQELEEQYGKDFTEEKQAKLEAVWKDLPKRIHKGPMVGPGPMGPGPMGPAEASKPSASEAPEAQQPGKAPAVTPQPTGPSQKSDKSRN